MSTDLLTTVVSGAAGLVCGGLASLIAPWVHWGIEKRRRKLERLMSLVKSWEAMIARVFNLTLLDTVPTPGAALLAEPEFTSLKPYLSPGTLQSLFARYLIEGDISSTEPVWLRKVQKDIQATKAKWGLE